MDGMTVKEFTTTWCAEKLKLLPSITSTDRLESDEGLERGW